MVEMEVEFFSVSQGYGFCEGGDQRVFFRVSCFQTTLPGEPMPIAGERVSVFGITQTGKSPSARIVRRKETPTLLRGRVKSFDSKKGWGFAEVGPQIYFMHRSDFTDTPYLPLIGSCVEFYPGVRRGKPRACYVKRCGVE
jgi:cold shock CspA family protein